MKTYRIQSRCIAQPVPAGWREQLARRLGGRPRRLGLWAELGLYGALECLERSKEQVLPAHAGLILSSRHGPARAVRSALDQTRDGLPLPLTFLQTQPSQLLAALSAQLQWRGDARFICHPDPLALVQLAMAIAHRLEGGLLMGWVDELDVESSVWLRLQPVAHQEAGWQKAGDFATLTRDCSHIRLGPDGLEVLS